MKKQTKSKMKVKENVSTYPSQNSYGHQMMLLNVFSYLQTISFFQLLDQGVLENYRKQHFDACQFLKTESDIFTLWKKFDSKIYMCALNCRMYTDSFKEMVEGKLVPIADGKQKQQSVSNNAPKI